MSIGSRLWRARKGLPNGVRRKIRVLTDPFSGPLGSIRGAHVGNGAVALTFDDGPDPLHTPGVLDALARHDMRATWFVIVERAEAHPELIRRMIAEGHDVGLHGADHKRLTRLAYGELRAHIEKGSERLTALTASKPVWFRPPYGSQNFWSYVIVRRLGMQVVVWSADCEDWVQRPEALIAQQAIEHATPGGVLLLHDGLAADPKVPAPNPHLDRSAIAEMIMVGLKSRGLRGVSVSELLTLGKPHFTVWFRP